MGITSHERTGIHARTLPHNFLYFNMIIMYIYQLVYWSVIIWYFQQICFVTAYSSHHRILFSSLAHTLPPSYFLSYPPSFPHPYPHLPLQVSCEGPMGKTSLKEPVAGPGAYMRKDELVPKVFHHPLIFSFRLLLFLIYLKTCLFLIQLIWFLCFSITCHLNL